MGSFSGWTVNGNSVNGTRNWDTNMDYTRIDEFVGTPDDTAIIDNTNNTSAQVASFLMGPLPSDFKTANTIQFQFRRRVSGAQTNTRTLGARIVKESDGTVLAAADAGGSFVSFGIITNTTFSFNTASATYVNLTATKADWEDARLEIQNNVVKNHGGDSNGLEVDVAAVNILSYDEFAFGTSDGIATVSAVLSAKYLISGNVNPVLNVTGTLIGHNYISGVSNVFLTPAIQNIGSGATTLGLGAFNATSQGQQFINVDYIINSIDVVLSKEGSPVFDIRAEIWSVDGSFVPVSILETSSNLYSASSLPTNENKTWKRFYFNGDHYNQNIVIVLTIYNSSLYDQQNYVRIDIQTNLPDVTAVLYNGSWNTWGGTTDMKFILNSGDGSVRGELTKRVAINALSEPYIYNKTQIPPFASTFNGFYNGQWTNIGYNIGNPNGRINEVRLCTSKFGSPDHDIVAEIWSVSGSLPNALLETSTNTIAASSFVNNGIYTFIDFTFNKNYYNQDIIILLTIKNFVVSNASNCFRVVYYDSNPFGFVDVYRINGTWSFGGGYHTPIKLSVDYSNLATLTEAAAAGGILGTINNIAATAGILTAKGSLSGASNGSATTTVSSITLKIDANINGIATVQGELHADAKGISQSDGVATITGVLTAKGDIDDIVNAVATTAGILTALGSLVGVSNSTSTTTVTSITLKIDSNINGTATTSGILIASAFITGIINALASTTSVLVAKGDLDDIIDNVASTSGILSGKGALAGASNGTATINSNLTVAPSIGELIGEINGVATIASELIASGALIGSSNPALTVTGVLQARGLLEVVVNGLATVSGEWPTTAQSTNIATVTGVLSASGNLVGVSNNTNSDRQQLIHTGGQALYFDPTSAVNNALGQRFVSFVGVIRCIRIPMYIFDSIVQATGELRMEIWNTNGSGLPTTVIEKSINVVKTSDFKPYWSTTTEGNYGWFNFYFPGNNYNQQLAIVLNVENPKNQGYIVYWLSTSNVKANENVVRRINTTWSTVTQDFKYQINPAYVSGTLNNVGSLAGLIQPNTYFDVRKQPFHLTGGPNRWGQLQDPGNTYGFHAQRFTLFQGRIQRFTVKGYFGSNTLPTHNVKAEITSYDFSVIYETSLNELTPSDWSTEEIRDFTFQFSGRKYNQPLAIRVTQGTGTYNNFYYRFQNSQNSKIKVTSNEHHYVGTLGNFYNDDLLYAIESDYVSATLIAKSLAGSINGQAVVSGSFPSVEPIDSVVNALATVTGALIGKVFIDDIVDGVATVNGTLSANGSLSGTINASTTTSSALSSIGPLSGAINGIATLIGFLVSNFMFSTSNGSSTTSGELTGTGELAGVSNGVSTISGQLTSNFEISSTINGLATVTGVLTSKGDLDAPINNPTTVTGTLTASGSLEGTINGASTTTSVLTLIGDLQSSINNSATITGVLTAQGSLSGTVNGSTSTSSQLSGNGQLEGVSNGIATTDGILTNGSTATAISGTINAIATTSATLTGLGSLIGVSNPEGDEFIFGTGNLFEAFEVDDESIGQTINIQNKAVLWFEFEFDKIGSPDFVIQGEIWSLDGGGLPQNLLQVSTNTVQATTVTGTRDFYRFNFDITSINYNGHYALVAHIINHTVGDGSNYIRKYFDDQNPFTGGYEVSNPIGVLWSSDLNDDLNGNVRLKRGVSGNLNGTSYGISNGIANVSGTLSGMGILSGISNGTSTVSLGLFYAEATSNGITTISGTLTGKGNLESTINGQATVTGIMITDALLGLVNGISTVTGLLTANGSLSGTSNANSTVSGTLTFEGLLVGVSDGAATVSASLTAKGALVGSSFGFAEVLGSFFGQIDGESFGFSWTDGTLTGTGNLIGISDGSSTAIIIWWEPTRIYGVSNGRATVTGTLTQAYEPPIDSTCFHVVRYIQKGPYLVNYKCYGKKKSFLNNQICDDNE